MKLSPVLGIIISIITILTFILSYIFFSVLAIFYLYVLVGLIGGAMLLAIFKFKIVQSNAVKASFTAFPIITIYFNLGLSIAISANALVVIILLSLVIVGVRTVILRFFKAGWEYYAAVVGGIILLGLILTLMVSGN